MAAELRRVLADVIREEVRDPRLARVTVCEVDVARDLASADVFVAVLGIYLGEGDDRRQEVVAALKRAAPFLRASSARRMRMRGMPELRFRYDDSFDRGARVSALIEEASREDEETG